VNREILGTAGVGYSQNTLLTAMHLSVFLFMAHKDTAVRVTDI
jgi:hypothetical protein